MPWSRAWTAHTPAAPVLSPGGLRLRLPSSRRDVALRLLLA
jgi:hypothetical protein